jgi:glycosyltransferase involved in cell wall biosynthesis
MADPEIQKQTGPIPESDIGLTVWPKFTVVTPSFNQGQFLEQTICSVLDQKYPNFEYIIMDGGSTDNSVEIIKKYSEHLASWESTPDRGQAHAINKGFTRARGEILCWINSDDWYLPGAFYSAAIEFQKRKADFLYGGCLLRHEESAHDYFVRMPQTLHRISSDLSVFDFIDQPSSFWSRRVWEAIGPLDESLNYAFDWDFFIRVSRQFELHCTEAIFSAYRHHEQHKSGVGGDARLAELVEIVRRYSTPDWVEAYEECRRSLLPNSRQVAEKWRPYMRFVGGARLYEMKKNATLRPAIRRHGEQKIRIASIMTGIDSW